MTRTFEYTFEELPLLIELGLEIGLVSGVATISYSAGDAEDWGILSIEVDGHRKSTAEELARGMPHWKHGRTALDATTPMHGMIHHMLENDKRETVQKALFDHLEDRWDNAADNRADARRDALMSGGAS